MDKIVLNNLDKVNIINYKEVEVLGQKVMIKDYLPIEQKLDIAEMVLQNSIDFNFVNDIKTEVYFNVYFVAKYTNVDLTMYMEDIWNAYDLIDRSGLLQYAIEVAGADYDLLYDYVQTLINKYEKYQTSVSGVVDRFISEVPDKLSQMINDLEQIDTTKVAGLFDNISKSGGNENAILQTITGQK